jgi:hypothetical protein
MLGLESVSDMNGDGHVTMEDVNLCAAKAGKTMAPVAMAPTVVVDPINNPIVKEQVALAVT